MSTNPYAHPQGSPDGPAKSPEEQLIADYELAVGPNNDYFVPRFRNFDEGGSKAGWNWPAFFVAAAWFLYRKMYGIGIPLLFLPLLQLIIVSIILAATKVSAVGIAASLVVVVAPWILLSIFANALYWRRIRGVLRNIPSAFANQPDKRALRIERHGGTAIGPMIGILAGVGVVGIAVLGILAAIAIPAYQDYTIRAQVSEGLNLAAPVKAQVAEFWATESRWPEQEDLGADVPSGKYVEMVSVKSGSVIIVYGGQANAILQRQGLALAPGLDSEGNIVWVCGNAPAPAGVSMSGGVSGSDVANKHLPAKCRGEAQN